MTFRITLSRALFPPAEIGVEGNAWRYKLGCIQRLHHQILVHVSEVLADRMIVIDQGHGSSASKDHLTQLEQRAHSVTIQTINSNTHRCMTPSFIPVPLVLIVDTYDGIRIIDAADISASPFRLFQRFTAWVTSFKNAAIP